MSDYLQLQNFDLILFPKGQHHLKSRSKDCYHQQVQNSVNIIFVSTLNKQRIHKAIETAVKVFKVRSEKIKTRKLNDILLPIIASYPPPAIKGKYVKIKYITQLPTHHPQFAFFCNLPQYVKEPYKRFLENKIRENFDFTGVPITIFLRKKQL